MRAPRSITIWLTVGARLTLRAGIQPFIPFGRIGTLIRYQAFPSEPSVVESARISWVR